MRMLLGVVSPQSAEMWGLTVVWCVVCKPGTCSIMQGINAAQTILRDDFQESRR